MIRGPILRARISATATGDALHVSHSTFRPIVAIAALASLAACCVRYARNAQSARARPSYDRRRTIAPTGRSQSVRSVAARRRSAINWSRTSPSTLKLDTMVRQDSQVLEKSKTALRRQQRRVVTTTHVNDGMTVAVLVRYAEAAQGNRRRHRRRQARRIEARGATGRKAKSTASAATAKRCSSPTKHGSVPPLDEYEIVALNMESLGRPNPLADFLAGKTLTVGQRIALPNEVAEKLMGLGGEMGEVTQFELTLAKRRDDQRRDTAPCSSPTSKPRRSIRRRCGWPSKVRWRSRSTPAARSTPLSPAQSACPKRAAVFPRLTK